MADAEALVRTILGPDAEAFDYAAGAKGRRGWRIYVRDGLDDRAARLVDANWRRCHESDVRLFVGAAMFEVAPGRYAEGWGHVTWDPTRQPPPAGPDPMLAPPGVTQVFALPGLPVLDVIEFCRTGSHNAWTAPPETVIEEFRAYAARRGPEFSARTEQAIEDLRASWATSRHGREPWRPVRDAMRHVMDLCPFDIQFADEAGLNATFLRPLTLAEAGRAAAIILDVDTDILELPIGWLNELGAPVPDGDPGDLDYYESAMAKYLLLAGKFKLWWD